MFSYKYKRLCIAVSHFIQEHWPIGQKLNFVVDRWYPGRNNKPSVQLGLCNVWHKNV
jgi:hypothetical protein